jgi:hypothetical protein
MRDGVAMCVGYLTGVDDGAGVAVAIALLAVAAAVLTNVDIEA